MIRCWVRDPTYNDVMTAFRSHPADTTPEAQRVQDEAYRRMGGAGRMRLVWQMNEALDARLRAGIRHRHPRYTDEQVRLAFAKLKLGAVLFARVHPGVEIEP